jgi:hypothetical protein
MSWATGITIDHDTESGVYQCTEEGALDYNVWASGLSGDTAYMLFRLYEWDGSSRGGFVWSGNYYADTNGDIDVSDIRDLKCERWLGDYAPGDWLVTGQYQIYYELNDGGYVGGSTKTEIIEINAAGTETNSERGIHIFGYEYSKEDSSSLNSDDSTLSTTFNSTNYSNVTTEDSTFDTISGDGYLNYLFKAYKSGGGNFLINVKAKSTKAPSSNTVYLQVYNRDTTSWENLDSDSSTGANTVFTLSGGKNSSLTDYYDSDNLLSLRVYQEVT